MDMLTDKLVGQLPHVAALDCLIDNHLSPICSWAELRWKYLVDEGLDQMQTVGWLDIRNEHLLLPAVGQYPRVVIENFPVAIKNPNSAGGEAGERNALTFIAGRACLAASPEGGPFARQKYWNVGRFLNPNYFYGKTDEIKLEKYNRVVGTLLPELSNYLQTFSVEVGSASLA